MGRKNLKLMCRPDWQEYFMGIAMLIAQRGTCPRRKVGAIIVDPNNRIIAGGYAASPKGLPHCVDVGCLMVDGHCLRTVHAEQNAIIQCATVTGTCLGTTIYTTCQPCIHCAKMIINAGIQAVVMDEEYIDYGVGTTPTGLDMLKEAGIHLEWYKR